MCEKHTITQCIRLKDGTNSLFHNLKKNVNVM